VSFVWGDEVHGSHTYELIGVAAHQRRGASIRGDEPPIEVDQEDCVIGSLEELPEVPLVVGCALRESGVFGSWLLTHLSYS
jgi:hypothetical protein